MSIRFSRSPVSWWVSRLSVDITARKQAEEALAQQSQFLQLLIDTIPTPVFYKDAEGRYLGCNQGLPGLSRAYRRTRSWGKRWIV